MQKNGVTRHGPRLIWTLLANCLVAACSNDSHEVPVADTAATAPLQRALGGADCSDTAGYDTLIIGAGLAGLSAAKALRSAWPDAKVLILERNDRIGGRAHSADIAGVPIDYGGAWLHGETQDGHYSNPLARLVDETPGFQRAATEFDVPFYFDNRFVGSGDPLKTLFDSAVESFEHALQTPDHGDVSLAYVPTDPVYDPVRALLIGNAGPLESAAELDRTSAAESAQFLAGEDYLLNKSMGAWVKNFGQDQPTCLNSTVKSIRYTAEGVTVEAGGRSYRARTALVTVSVGVLQAGRIAFDPPLPDWKTQAIQHLTMGQMQKVIIPFKRDIFPAGQPANAWVLYQGSPLPQELAMAQQHTPPLPALQERVMGFVIKPLAQNMAIGFFGGDWAKALEGRCAADPDKHGSGPAAGSDCDGLAIQVTRTALSRMYGAAEVDSAIDASAIEVTHWSLDETSLGAYSVALPEHADAREILRRPIGGGADGAGAKRLFFAGEGTAEAKFNGSYPGAWQTGLQAATEIQASLSRP